MTTFAIIHNIALFLLVGRMLNCGRSIHSSGIRDGIVRSIGFSCIAIFFVPRHTLSICVAVYQPLCISGRRSMVWSLYGTVVRVWEIYRVALGTIYISRYQNLGRPLNTSRFVSSRWKGFEPAIPSNEQLRSTFRPRGHSDRPVN